MALVGKCKPHVTETGQCAVCKKSEDHMVQPQQKPRNFDCEQECKIDSGWNTSNVIGDWCDGKVWGELSNCEQRQCDAKRYIKKKNVDELASMSARSCERSGVQRTLFERLRSCFCKTGIDSCMRHNEG